MTYFSLKRQLEAGNPYFVLFISFLFMLTCLPACMSRGTAYVFWQELLEELDCLYRKQVGAPHCIQSGIWPDGFFKEMM